MHTKNPPHPGDLIRTEIIEALGLSVTQAAEMLGVRQTVLSDLLNEEAGLSPEMALRMDSRFSGSKTCFFFGMSSSSAQQAVQQAGVGHGERVAPFKNRACVVQPVARHGDFSQIEQPRAVAG